MVASSSSRRRGRRSSTRGNHSNDNTHRNHSNDNSNTTPRRSALLVQGTNKPMLLRTLFDLNGRRKNSVRTRRLMAQFEKVSSTWFYVLEKKFVRALPTLGWKIGITTDLHRLRVLVRDTPEWKLVYLRRFDYKPTTSTTRSRKKKKTPDRVARALESAVREGMKRETFAHSTSSRLDYWHRDLQPWIDRTRGNAEAIRRERGKLRARFMKVIKKAYGTIRAEHAVKNASSDDSNRNSISANETESNDSVGSLNGRRRHRDVTSPRPAKRARVGPSGFKAAAATAVTAAVAVPETPPQPRNRRRNEKRRGRKSRRRHSSPNPFLTFSDENENRRRQRQRSVTPEYRPVWTTTNGRARTPTPPLSPVRPVYPRLYPHEIGPYGYVDWIGNGRTHTYDPDYGVVYDSGDGSRYEFAEGLGYYRI